MRPYYLINIAIERTMRTRWEDTVTQEKWMVMIDSVRTLCTIAIHFDTDFAFAQLGKYDYSYFYRGEETMQPAQALAFRANERTSERTMVYPDDFV